MKQASSPRAIWLECYLNVSGKHRRRNEVNVLTDEEIDAVTDKQWDGIRGREIAAAHRAYARAIEAEVIRKLAAGVSVEPNGYDPLSDQYLYKQDTLQTAIEAARVQENERCLAMMDAIGCDWRDAGDMAKFYATNYLREAIRALLGKEPT